MRKNLFEAYKNRLSRADKIAIRTTGERMSDNVKLVTAQCLDNVSRYMNEAFTNSINVATQVSDLGAIKKAFLDVTNVLIPTLIAHELVLVRAMPARHTVLYY